MLDLSLPSKGQGSTELGSCIHYQPDTNWTEFVRFRTGHLAAFRLMHSMYARRQHSPAQCRIVVVRSQQQAVWHQCPRIKWSPSVRSVHSSRLGIPQRIQHSRKHSSRLQTWRCKINWVRDEEFHVRQAPWFSVHGNQIPARATALPIRRSEFALHCGIWSQYTRTYYIGTILWTESFTKFIPYQ